MRRLSGQSLIFEQVMLFGIGVAIFVVLFAVFTIYQHYFASVNLHNQLDEVNDVVVLNIIKLVEKDNVTAHVIVDIPRRIGDEGYEIVLSDRGLNVTSLLTGVSKSSSLYGLNESYNLTGSVMSIFGRIIIYKKENKIILS
jgi:hypothetical protein